jgi:hypothetical protein
MKKLMFFLIVFAALAIIVHPSFAALNANTTYTITIQKMNSDGTVSDYSTTTAKTDADGKLTFSLGYMPTNSEANFIVFIVKDSAGTTVRKGFVPAPPAGATNLVGINSLSTDQTEAILAAGTKIGTDDPIPVAYLLTLLRSDSATADDALLLAQLGKNVILGSGGFEDTLTANDVTATQLADFKSYLIYNPTSGKKTIADMTASFKTAVDSADATTAKQEMQKAGGFMADVFMDAAGSAGIDYSLILAAHDATGTLVQNAENMDIMDQVSDTVNQSMEQSMSSFFRRIAAVKVKEEYIKALNTLNASGTQVNTFTTAVGTMMTAMAAIDSLYSDYFMDPQAYLTAHPGETTTTMQTAIETAYQTAFATFQTNIQSTDADINTMKAAVATAFGITLGQLPWDFGKYYDFSGTQKNWPIPQTVMVNWMAAIIGAGGSFSTTQRDTTAIPTFMQWLGVCSDTSYWDMVTCQSHGKTWTQQRRNYSLPPFASPSSAFNAYLGLQEDLQIIESARYSIYNGGQPTKEQEKAAKLLFTQRLEALAGYISGTTDGTTTISAEQKKAIVKLLMQPSMD